MTHPDGLSSKISGNKQRAICFSEETGKQSTPFQEMSPSSQLIVTNPIAVPEYIIHILNLTKEM